MYDRVNKNINVTIKHLLYCLVHSRNSKDWKWLSLEWSNNSHFLQVMWSWIYFWVKSLIFALYHWVQRLQFTNANGKECGRRLCVESVYTVTSRLWMLHLYMLAANKKCYLKIYVNPFGKMFLLNLWRRSRPWSWSWFVFFSRESVFTPMDYTFLMKPFGME